MEIGESMRAVRREPSFPGGLPLARPAVAGLEDLIGTISEILESGMLTNGPHVRRFEAAAEDYFGVRHCVAVSSCTAGLMLVLRVSEISSDVVVPSFTFAATAHAIAWNGLRPVFADIDPHTLTLSATAAHRAMGVRTGAILATHTFGTPCDVEGLQQLAHETGVRLFFDAAHAFGSKRGGQMVGGFGDAEVFSLSPTKVVIAGEGGLIATNDDLLAERCRIGRDYGNPGDYDCRFVGLNARMSEIHAAVALASMRDLEERIEERNRLVDRYRAELGPIRGIGFPSISHGDRSTYKDMTVLVDETKYGIGPDTLATALAQDGIETRRYYAPPVHTMQAYRTHARTPNLTSTERAARMALTLPLWVGMDDGDVGAVADAFRRAQSRAGA